VLVTELLLHGQDSKMESDMTGGRTRALSQKKSCALMFLVFNAETQRTPSTAEDITLSLCELSVSAMKNTVNPAVVFIA